MVAWDYRGFDESHEPCRFAREAYSSRGRNYTTEAATWRGFSSGSSCRSHSDGAPLGIRPGTRKMGRFAKELCRRTNFPARSPNWARGSRTFTRGEAIYGMNDWYQNGALAAYCITRPDWIAPKPRTLDHERAASVPLDALTAWQGLFVRAKLQPAERVLIHGGAGAVGIFAIQLARWRGAHVITTVSPHNFDFVKELGADQVIDYKSAPFEEQARNIDVVFDAVGGDTLRRSWSVLKRNGRLVTIVSPDESGLDERTKAAFFIVEPNRSQLHEVGQMIDAGGFGRSWMWLCPSRRRPMLTSGKLRRKGVEKWWWRLQRQSRTLHQILW